jgi:hypothetical protein
VLGIRRKKLKKVLTKKVLMKKECCEPTSSNETSGAFSGDDLIIASEED